MPAWSPEIANEFIRFAKAEGRQFDQLQLQALVYIAHGWCLATSGEPLTGDRPEAWEFGPMYRRLADALTRFGRAPVSKEISAAEAFPNAVCAHPGRPAMSELEQSETALLAQIYENYGLFESWQLSAITRKGDTPWRRVFSDGVGKWRDIPHDLIKAQFVEFLKQSDTREQTF